MPGRDTVFDLIAGGELHSLSPERHMIEESLAVYKPFISLRCVGKVKAMKSGSITGIYQASYTGDLRSA